MPTASPVKLHHWHVGSVQKEGIGPDQAVLSHSLFGFLRPTQTMPVAMTQADINEVNAAFAQAAADSRAVGFYVEAPVFISQFQN